MLCAVIKGPSYDEVKSQITQALPLADVVEWRVDLWHKLDMAALEALRSQFAIPMILTLRSSHQGGRFADSKRERLKRIQDLLSLKPEYVDLEHGLDDDLAQLLTLHEPGVKLILSHHDFTGTPGDLPAIYHQMQKTQAWGYKIAVKADSALDAMRLLCWAKKAQGNKIVMSMGAQGGFSRILAPLIDSAICYASLEASEGLALGQIPLEILAGRYRYRSLNRKTTVYALIGDPVEQSIGDVVHNHFFKQQGLNAVYVKIPLKADEMAVFLKLAKEFAFGGISVTMPLKEAAFKLADEVEPGAQSIGAINTLTLREGQWVGSNTDGVGALDVIEQHGSVAGKHLVLLGAGGAGKAIAWEAHRRKAKLTVVNRDANAAIRLAANFGGLGLGMDQMEKCLKPGYAILVNSTPVEMPIKQQHLLGHAIVMDVKSKPKDTKLLLAARQKGCRLIYGYQMFVEQAVGQLMAWNGRRLDPAVCRRILNEQVAGLLE